MSSPALRIFCADGANTSENPPNGGQSNAVPTGPRIRDAVRARIEHLRLRVQSGTFSAEHFKNIQTTLTRFEAAWYVGFADRAAALVPRSGMQREKLEYEAAGEDKALRQAQRLLDKKEPGVVLRNGDRPINDAKNDDLLRWLAANPQWGSGHTKTNNLRMIFDCFEWFAEEQDDARNPFKKSRLPKFELKSRREATDAEYVALMKGGCRELRRALWCLYNLDGIRPGEMRGMLWDDFNWDGGYVLTYKHKTARLKRKPRVFLLTARRMRFFRNLFKQKPPLTLHVFLNTKSKPWTRRALALNIRRTAQKLGLDDAVAEKVSAYQFRHAFATQADESGLAEQDTAMLMGHANTSMLREVYSKASRKIRHLRGAAERAEKLRREARKARGPSAPPGQLF